MAESSKKKEIKNRIHEKTPVIKEVYKKLSGPKNNWVSPQLALEEIFNIYDAETGKEKDLASFAITDIDYAGGRNNPKSVFSYSIRGTAPKKMTFGRFWNIISELNKQKV